MSYKSIIVNLAADLPPTAIVKVGIELAERFGSHLIGLAAADVPPLVATGEGMVYEGEVMQIERTEIEKRLAELRAEFESLVPASITSEWGQAVCSPTRFLSTFARVADLIVIAESGDNVFRAVDVGSLALGIGRPVLVTGNNVEHIRAKTVLVAWKDTREARRAVADALPFLGKADEVVVATIAARGDDSVRDSLADVAVYLEHHGIVADTELIAGEVDGEQLLTLARSIRADMIISGAYGHSRLREWAFGGVTRTLIEERSINRFLSY
ncbi:MULTISPECIES: universal stress protein [unclassified Mesorhizobium]|uniref:universal stress protein n=1 Tax=unclassified Mesorhizobium TaxID=325217 RepID=UPI000FCC36A5|nr:MULTISPECIES: universal stress protein [unclassified Mesorhizobium]MBZ9717885.1 universal stress protein [Mesorhizobium sp. AD1-1]RUY96554.1 universal stress protein [Mesorhizobium sp. M7A.F.Ca.CA.001.12.2.1]RUZ29428.1 universal stress protein [Mesorhizobium sp. M7A.F.Ca.US.007.01.2.1]RUZ36608.1 universal stress protein [Mesorhizobium sp. M7A.F.Ca.US.003.02.1.1]RUZ50820.1 universal stress protein [Mesorhizobium sp. M7A.F.Ca.US.007.01.1.1]